jgi:hypothetical protein
MFRPILILFGSKHFHHMKKISFSIALVVVIVLCNRCSEDPVNPVPITDGDKELPARWADMTLRTIRASWPNSPTYTSRSLGYMGLTMYESIVNGSPVHKSMVGQVNGLDQLPQPEAGAEYNWVFSLNAAQAFMLKSLYPHAPSFDAIDSLENAVYENELLNSSLEVAERSVFYGKVLAAAIFEWSKTDGGHEGYLHHFDPDYVFPTGPGYWVPPSSGQSASPFPLHPYWGSNRTFVSANGSLPVPEMIPYSTSTSSDYYKLFEEVYNKRMSLSAEDKRIAAWWADDPTQSASPPGHSYNLATIAVTSADASMFDAAETYAKVGMAVADAFICCWKIKYTYHSGRPYPFIVANIDNSYQQFWPEPPFPAFSSGHATQSAAAARAMISVFGNDFALVDNTYESRATDFQDIAYRSRTFSNIWQTATECAYSRFLGGIHTRHDNETGSDQGKMIGDNVVALSWKK